MNPLQKLDDQLLYAVNSYARGTPWLHAPALVYAKYGVALFGVLLLAGVLLSRRREGRVLAKAGWACIATLAALGATSRSGRRSPRPDRTSPTR